MSCSAGAGAFVKLTRLFVKIHRWVFFKMSMARHFCGSNGIPPASSMLKTNCVIGCRRKLLFILLLGLLATGSFWFFSMFDSGALWRNGKSSESCETRAKLFLEHFNVSDNQLRALTTLFSESDQIASFECTREPGSGMPLRNGIACALKVPCLEKQDFCKHNVWVTENVDHNNQCPVKDLNIPQKLDPSMLEYLSFVSQSTISRNWLTSVKNISQTMTGEDCATKHFKELYFCLVKESWWVFVGTIVSCTIFGFLLKLRGTQKHKQALSEQVAQQRQLLLQLHQQKMKNAPRGRGSWRKKLLLIFMLAGFATSFLLFWRENDKFVLKRVETLASMCDERARMLQDQFNVSMNHVHALAVLVSTFHHGKQPSAIDQKTFGKYTEKTDFERPLTSGVAYALKVLHSEREQFEKQHGWTIKKMETEDQTLVQDCIPEKLDPAPVQDEYAPVIFSQETVSHIVSIDMMSGKEDRENILRARASGKGVLTSPFKLLKSNHLGVVLTFAVYNIDLPLDATPEQRIKATVGYLGASYDVPSLVEKLLHQLASKQTIVVNVYDTTNASAPISMYGTDISDTGLLHISYVDFGDPLRKHEMHCRFKQKPPLPWTAINSSLGVLVITLLLGHIFYAAINRIAEVEKDYLEMMELKARAEAADVAKSQFLATVSHEIRTPMNGVLGMLQMLMDTRLDKTQLDYAQTAHASGIDLITLINDVLDQAKIESGRLEPESVPFDLHQILDGIVSLFSTKANEKGIEFAVYVSDRVPDVLIGDPGRVRQIITNLVGNSFKFTRDKGHIFVTVHLADEVRSRYAVTDKVLQHGSGSNQDRSSSEILTLSGFPVVNRWNSWDSFRMIYTKETWEIPGMVRLLVTIEDTGVGIPLDAQCRIFTPFMQADSSTSRTYGGTGIGLSISRCLVELMGGEIGFVSEPGTGSTFSLTLSFRKGEAGSLDKLQHSYPDVSEFKGLRTLVVDDKSIRAEATRYQLERFGVTVDRVHSMQAACSYLTDCDPRMLAELAIILVDRDVWSKETGPAFYWLLKQQREECDLKLKVKHPKIFVLATSIGSTGLDGIANLQMKPIKPSFLYGGLQEALGSNKKWEVHRRKQFNPGNLLNGREVLVVDDNLVNRRVAEGALKKYGANVTCVESGSAAIKLLKPPHNFDACFMDLQMPEMDGFEATQQIRSVEDKFNEEIASNNLTNVACWHIPILAMTADVIQATSEKCLMFGMDGYVSKPFVEEQLYVALAKFFQSR